MLSLRKLSFFCGLWLISQSLTANDELRAIDQDVWLPYSRSFDELDGPMHRELYHPNIIRVLNDFSTLEGGTPYLDHVLEYMEGARSRDADMHIEFRFLKRTVSENEAFEEALARYWGKDREGNSVEFFSRFYALHRKVEGRWRMLADIDLGEIDKQTWLEAQPHVTAPK